MAIARRGLLLAAVAILLPLGAGCRLVQREEAQTQTFLQTLLKKPGAGSATNAMTLLQAEVMRDADLYVASVAAAADTFRARVNTPAGRLAAQQWKLIEATSAYINATGDNPLLNAVDMAVLATLSRQIVEHAWVGGTFGEAARPLLKVHTDLEVEAWKTLDPFLSAEQIQTLHELIDAYRQRFPDQRFLATVRLPELVETLDTGPAGAATRHSASLLSLLYLDPLAGLDPATQAVEQTRLLAQRGLYYAQRMPMLLAWQVELTTYQLAAEPEAREVLGDLKTLTTSAQSFAETAGRLPAVIHTEREGALNQFFEGLARERAELVAALNAQESRLRDLLPPAQQTLEAGTQAARAIDAAIGSLDRFVQSVSAPDTNAPAAGAVTGVGAGTADHPFDVREYGAAAAQIGAAARELNTALGSLDRVTPALSGLGDQAAADLRSVIRYAFLLALILILVAGLVAYTVLRLTRSPRAP